MAGIGVTSFFSLQPLQCMDLLPAEVHVADLSTVYHEFHSCVCLTSFSLVIPIASTDLLSFRFVVPDASTDLLSFRFVVPDASTDLLSFRFVVPDASTDLISFRLVVPFSSVCFVRCRYVSADGSFSSPPFNA